MTVVSSLLCLTSFFCACNSTVVVHEVAVLVLLCTSLIYSLLLIDVETRRTEMGIMRMLGCTKAGVVAVVVLQAALYAVPAFGLGILYLVIFAGTRTKTKAAWPSP